MARLQSLKLPKGVEIDEVSNDNFFTHPSARSVPTTLAVKDYLRDEINKHDQTFMPDGMYRNAIINGNFDIWQRGTSFTASGYTADRWKITFYTGGSVTTSQQQFDVQQIEVPNNPKYYMRINIDAAPSAETYLEYRIEDVQSFAGQTVTVSFWAKSTTPYNRFRMHQQFGSGGSAIISIADIHHTLSNNWQKYSFTVDVPSLSGKTIGPGSSLSFRPVSVGAVTGVIDIAQVQLNIGDKPLPFAPRPIAEELALCQRYYQKSYDYPVTPGTNIFNGAIMINASKTLNAYDTVFSYNQMRTAPTITLYSRHSGDPGKAFDYDGSVDVPCSAVGVTSHSASVRINATDQTRYAVHWTADAEL